MDQCTVRPHLIAALGGLRSLPWKAEPPAGHCLVCLGPVNGSVCLSRWLNTIQKSVCVVSTMSAMYINAVRGGAQVFDNRSHCSDG